MKVKILVGLALFLSGGFIIALRIPDTIRIERISDLPASLSAVDRALKQHFRTEEGLVRLDPLAPQKTRVTWVAQIDRTTFKDKLFWAFLDKHTPTEARLERKLQRLSQLVKTD